MDNNSTQDLFKQKNINQKQDLFDLQPFEKKIKTERQK